MKNSLSLGFSLLLVLLVVSYCLTYEAFQNEARTAREIAEAQGMRIEILALLKTYVDAETGQRGFLLTGDERYLEPYELARKFLSSGEVRQRSVLAPIEQLKAIRARVNPQERVKLAELERIIGIRRTAGLDAAIAEVKQDTGKALMDSLRAVLDEYDGEQRRTTLAKLDHSATQRRQVLLLSTLASLILGASLVGLFFLTQRNLAERERLLKIAQEAKDALQKALAAERAAHSQATHANKLKDEFIAVVSHELRTPLNAIVGWTSLLREGVADEKELREGLDTIDRNAHVQAHLVDDLLDISRIVTGKVRLNIAEVNLRGIAVSVVDGLRPAADARGVTVTINATAEAAEVLGDSDRLQQVVWNLLSNAIKFTPRGGHVEVTMQNHESRVALEVTDSGQGIAADFLPRIFDRFSQADTATTRGQAGLGLGLAITRHLVELHGGNISARSPGEGCGATFRVEIPIVAVRELKKQLADREHGAAVMSSPAPELPPEALNDLRVLAVDDQADTLAVVSRVLTRAGVNVRVASNVAEALSILNDWRADVVISDIGMPGQDGYSFVRELRDHPKAEVREVRAIALTAFARDQDRKEAIDAGFDDHLAKPVNAAVLLRKVAQVAASVR